PYRNRNQHQGVDAGLCELFCSNYVGLLASIPLCAAPHIASRSLGRAFPMQNHEFFRPTLSIVSFRCGAVVKVWWNVSFLLPPSSPSITDPVFETRIFDKIVHRDVMFINISVGFRLSVLLRSRKLTGGGYGVFTVLPGARGHESYAAFFFLSVTLPLCTRWVTAGTLQARARQPVARLFLNYIAIRCTYPDGCVWRS
uniref:Uncharacterized protein n=1 Tax=Anopheles quadriannulatus TaxID=34691 RepID=A0A182XRV7_ANOQN